MILRTVTGAVAAAALLGTPAGAATPAEIRDAIRKGAAFLKTQPAPAGPSTQPGKESLLGIALLESGTPASDPLVQALARHVRDESFAQTSNYGVAAGLIFLDRLGDPADRPIIQMLGIRLVASQTEYGGWGYDIAQMKDGEPERLRKAFQDNQLVGGGGEPGKPVGGAGRPFPGRLHPEVIKHAAAITPRPPGGFDGDNSNTQFAILALWVARRHGVLTETALARAEVRFLKSQIADTGGWGYNTGATHATPAMTCAGLLALAVGQAVEHEKRVGAPADLSTTPQKPDLGSGKKPADPFFTPPPPKKPAAPPPPAARPANDPRVVAARAGFAFLGRLLLNQIKPPGEDWGNAHYDQIYSLWSLERTAVIYGVEKIAGVDWHQAGADYLLKNQQANGSWASKHGEDVGTSLAVLFLLKSNLAKDINGSQDTELRAGGSKAGGDTIPGPKSVGGNPAIGKVPLAEKLAADTLKTSGAAFTAAVARLKTEKGADYTQALAAVANKADGARKKEARDALAERLTRMTANTLRAFLADPDAELRRGAALACGMKDDKAHVPDLVARIADPDDAVSQAAKAALKSLTFQDFGPPAGATAAQKQTAAAGWKAWLATQPK